MRPLEDIRKSIQALELNSRTNSDFYREYVQFLIRKMSTMTVVDSEGKEQKIESFFANPERAVAKMKEDRNLVLPVVTISIDDIDDDVTRRRNANVIEMQTYWDKKSQRAIRIVSVAPKAAKVAFLINFWAKYTEDINQMMESIQLMFNPALNIKTKFSSTVKAFISQVSNASITSLGDREDRVLKKTIQISVETYIPNRKYLYTSTGQIEKISAEFDIDMDTEGLVDVTTSSMAWKPPDPKIIPPPHLSDPEPPLQRT